MEGGEGCEKPQLTLEFEKKNKKKCFCSPKKKVNLATFETPPVKNALCSSLRESFSTFYIFIHGVPRKKNLV
jgi:hypothetical protein